MIYFRSAWLALYVTSAIWAASLYCLSGELDGDFKGVPLPDLHTLLVATSFVVFSYLIWMGVVFRIIEKIHVPPFLKRWKDNVSFGEDRLISILVLCTQISFLIYCLVEGVGIAGSSEKSDLWVKYIWILFPADAMFLVYYGMNRRSPWIAPNLIIYVISNIARGWFGFWLMLLFMEGAYRIRENRFQWKKILVCLGVFIALIPYLVEIKWKIRDYGFSGINSSKKILELVQDTDWWSLFMLTIERSLLRLQHVDNVIVIISNSDLLSKKISNREFLYFFEEGLPQFTLERILNWPRIPDIHIKLLDYFAVYRPTALDVISNTHTGLVGWFWIAPMWWPLYLIYILFLTWSGIWLAKKLGGSGLLIEFIWLMGLVLLMNGWFWAYIEILQTLIIMIFLRFLVGKMSVFSLAKNKEQTKNCAQS